MDRVLKVINILLLVIVGMLLLTCVMALIQGSKVDLGKVADWWAGLSALATVGTFAVALIALKKAPNWFKQKSNETGFNHILLLMSEYDNIEHEIQRLYYDILMSRRYHPTHIALCNEMKILVHRTISLQSSLHSCTRWNISALPEVHRAFKRLKDFCEVSLKILEGGDFLSPEELNEKLSELKATITEDALSFKIDIEAIFCIPK